MTLTLTFQRQTLDHSHSYKTTLTSHSHLVACLLTCLLLLGCLVTSQHHTPIYRCSFAYGHYIIAKHLMVLGFSTYTPFFQIFLGFCQIILHTHTSQIILAYYTYTHTPTSKWAGPVLGWCWILLTMHTLIFSFLMNLRN